MEIKASNVNSKLKIKEDSQIGKKLAKEIMLFADDNSSAVSKKEFENKLNRMEKLSTQDLIKFIRSFDKDESIIELIIDEVGSSKQERKDACKKVLSALTNKAKELGIDTKDFEQQFIKELDHQFNSWGLVNTEKLDKIINAIVQSIENRQNFTAEDVQIVQNTPVEVGQEQANAVIETRLENAYSAFGERVGENGEMTDKHELQVPIVDDEGNPTGKFETKVETYNGQMQRDGIAADIADGFSKIWNNELYGNENGNTADLVRRDLKIMNKQLQELKEAKTQGEEAYKAKFKEIFRVEYDYANILAYQKAEATYINASSNHEFEMTFNRTLKTLLSPAPLREEIKTIYTAEIYINQTTATKEQVYNREFNNLAEFLTQKDSNGNEIKGSEILNKAFEEKGVANGTIEEKFEVLKQIAQALSKELHKSTLEAGNGKEFSEVQAMYDNSYKAAYGVENDIMKRVTDYNVSQEMGAGALIAGTVIAVSLIAACTGVGLVGVAAWTAGATIATEVIDRGTSGNALNALREQGLGEYLETVGKDVDWEATLKQAAMSGGAVLIGGGIAQGVTAIMKGSSSVAQFAAMLGSDVITDAALEFLTTKQITWQGMVFTVLLSTIGNAVQFKQMKANSKTSYLNTSTHSNIAQQTKNDFTKVKTEIWAACASKGFDTNILKKLMREYPEEINSLIKIKNANGTPRYNPNEICNILLNTPNTKMTPQEYFKLFINNSSDNSTIINHSANTAKPLQVETPVTKPTNIVQQTNMVNSTKIDQKYNFTKIDKIKAELERVLYSPHSQMPDFMKLIPEGASEQEIITFLQKIFHESKFFSRVSTCEIAYGKNFEFARLMSEICDNATGAISRGKSFDEVLDQIAKGYSKETTINTTQTKRIGKSGIYRGSHTKPANYLEVDGIKLFRLDNYDTGYGVSGAHDGYKEYVKRLNSARNIESPHKDFTLTKTHPSDYIMRHPYHEEVAKNMDIISERYKVYQDLVETYNKTGQLTANQRIQADNIISEIYYLMSHTCPFQRGSNGISDVLMRSQYSALGIDMPHIKSGIGLDLEAFCMDLKDYQMKWKTFFE